MVAHCLALGTKHYKPSVTKLLVRMFAFSPPWFQLLLVEVPCVNLSMTEAIYEALWCNFRMVVLLSSNSSSYGGFSQPWGSLFHLFMLGHGCHKCVIFTIIDVKDGKQTLSKMLFILVLPLLYAVKINILKILWRVLLTVPSVIHTIQDPELTKYWLILSQRFSYFFRKLLLLLYNFTFKWIIRLQERRKIVIKYTHRPDQNNFDG